MYPRSEQEINDLLMSGQISPMDAEMYRRQLIGQNSPENQLFQNPTMRTPSQFGQTIPDNNDPNNFLRNTTGSPDWAWNTGNSMPTNPYPQPDQYTVFNPQGQPKSPFSINDNPTREEYIRQQNQLGYDPTTAGENWDELYGKNSGTSKPGTNPYANLPLIFPGGSNLETEAYTLGRGLGLDKGTKGKGLMVGSSAASLLFGAARNVASGIGYENTNQLMEDWYREQQFGAPSRKYTANPQYKDNNYLGGNSYEDGGEQNPEQMMQDPQMQQIAGQISQALQQGNSPDQIVQQLVQNGMDQNHATQMVQMVMQQMQGQQAEVPQENEVMRMKSGGYFKGSIGKPIKFRYGGKMVSGVIKKIENGNLYLE